MLRITCLCGEIYHADQRHTGSNIQCTKCNRILEIEPPLEEPALLLVAGPSLFQKYRVVGALALLLLVIAVGLWFYFRPKGSSGPGVTAGGPDAGALMLRAERNAGQLLLSWNREAALVKTASKAVLSISDGDHREDVQLDLGQLRNGSIVYSPITNDVSFRLEVTDAKLGKSLNESVRALAGRPSPTPSASQTGPSRPANAQVAIPRTSPPTQLGPPDSRLPSAPYSLRLGSAPLGPGVSGGNSVVTVDNGTSSDALVRLVGIRNVERNVRNFYIPSGERFPAKRVPPGTYVLRAAFGKDWNPANRRFNYDRSFLESEAFEVTERHWTEPTEEGYIERTRTTDLSITLHKVLFGNFQTHQLSEEQFWQ